MTIYVASINKDTGDAFVKEVDIPTQFMIRKIEKRKFDIFKRGV